MATLGLFLDIQEQSELQSMNPTSRWMPIRCSGGGGGGGGDFDANSFTHQVALRLFLRSPQPSL
jgi:hypothetical protein